jgi:hypothetical protein
MPNNGSTHVATGTGNRLNPIISFFLSYLSRHIPYSLSLSNTLDHRSGPASRLENTPRASNVAITAPADDPIFGNQSIQPGGGLAIGTPAQRRSNRGPEHRPGLANAGAQRLGSRARADPGRGLDPPPSLGPEPSSSPWQIKVWALSEPLSSHHRLLITATTHHHLQPEMGNRGMLGAWGRVLLLHTKLTQPTTTSWSRVDDARLIPRPQLYGLVGSPAPPWARRWGTLIEHLRLIFEWAALIRTPDLQSGTSSPGADKTAATRSFRAWHRSRHVRGK